MSTPDGTPEDCTAHSSLQQMFIHAAESGWKEAERLIQCSCQQGLPKLDSEVDVSAVQLAGYQMSSEEIGDLYHQVYVLGNWSQSALVHLAIRTKLPREEGGILWGSKNSLGPGIPISCHCTGGMHREAQPVHY